MATKNARRRTRPTATHVCVYCLRRLTDADFNREHVLSEAFGTFNNAQVLHHSVCRECNQFFGDELEVRFARGAFEGMLRYQNGVKTPEIGAVHLPYVAFTVPDGNDWSGVRLSLMNDESGLRVQLIPQVAFFDSSQGRWVHVTGVEIDAGWLSNRADLKKSQMRIYAGSPEDLEIMALKLSENGVNFRKAGDLLPPQGLLKDSQIWVEITFTINQGIRRCVAKYAFNHLVLACGAEFVLGPDFDMIRRFIRHGGPTPYPTVVETFRPILHDDLPSARQTNGHLLTLSWAPSGFDLVGQVSLFNYITYEVSLCRHYSGALWRPIRSGLYYDVERKIVRPLRGVSTALIPRAPTHRDLRI